MDSGMIWTNRRFFIPKSIWKRSLRSWKTTKRWIWMWIRSLKCREWWEAFVIIRRIMHRFTIIIKAGITAMIRYITCLDTTWRDLLLRRLNVMCRKREFCYFPEHLILECTGSAESGREIMRPGGHIWKWMSRWCRRWICAVFCTQEQMPEGLEMTPQRIWCFDGWNLQYLPRFFGITLPEEQGDRRYTASHT